MPVPFHSIFLRTIPDQIRPERTRALAFQESPIILRLPCKLSKPTFSGIEDDSTSLLTRLDASAVRGWDSCSYSILIGDYH